MTAPKTVTRDEWQASVRNGNAGLDFQKTPYMLYVDEATGGTVWGPVRIVDQVGLDEYRHLAGDCFDPSKVPALRGRPCGDPRCEQARGCDVADDGPTCERCGRPLHKGAPLSPGGPQEWRDDNGHAYCETGAGTIAPHRTQHERETDEGLHAVADMPGEYRYGVTGLEGANRDDAERAGLLPEQRLARHRAALATLETMGQGDTQFADALRAAITGLGGDA